ncbi:uncharacterized protein LOC106716402 [Papilio machaon]|uniref:uncharacterized protein LOC106716402 n=1 Tax=Papilio machaon TaxID=76193 RepID=UPI001E663613|nr:uncharacterized protein LOC106716402 [Papilio machaon]
MAKSCCVDGCFAKDVVYFRFPNSRTQCKKWIEAINLTSKPSYNSVICSDHFRPDDYGVVRGKVRLKPKVVPISQNEQQNLNVTTKNNNSNKENTDSLDNQKIRNCKQKEKTEERKNVVEDVNGDEKKDTRGKRETKAMRETKETEDMRKRKDTTDGKDINDTRDTSSDDDEPLSKHCSTRDSLKKLSESIKQVDLNSNTNASTENDIEDMLTSYSIKQNKNVTDRQIDELNREEIVGENVVNLSTQENEPAPVFIEVAINEEQNNRDTGSPRDCLMLLESVQVELDPNELMMSDLEDNGPCGDQPEDPISLLTSSDDDDVIIEEPHIDTVEVSDATDEDDVPLVKLVPKTVRLRPRWRAPNPFYRKDTWGMYQYFCPQCNYRTPSKSEYKVHTIEHSTAVLVCHRCAFTTSSKVQYTRHMRRHKDARRFKCHLCSYKAKYQMSLVYHLKCHESVGDKCMFKCDKCDYVSSVKRYLMKHVLVCSARKIKSRRHKKTKSKEVRHS